MTGRRPSVVTRALRGVKRPVRDALRHRKQTREDREWSKIEWQIEREIDRIVAGGRTLIVGPWLSEVGYEVLYWIPFLRWVKAAFNVDPSRVVAVSRGGVSSWYEGVASRYVEVWDDFDPAEFAARTAERGAMKQIEISPFDREVTAAAERRMGTGTADVLHPSLMFRLFALFWSGHKPMSFLDSHTRFELQRPPSVIDPALLPRDYVAVKLYTGQTLPDTDENRRVVSSVIGELSEQSPVVLLDTGLAVDQHTDYEYRSNRVISARRWMTPRNNLAVQTQVIAGARAFVGTCGGLAWLAPMLGVDTSALLADTRNRLHAHLEVAMRTYHRIKAAQFAAVDVRGLGYSSVSQRNRESAGAS